MEQKYIQVTFHLPVSYIVREKEKKDDKKNKRWKKRKQIRKCTHNPFAPFWTNLSKEMKLAMNKVITVAACAIAS
jgi:hypothetical protein